MQILLRIRVRGSWIDVPRYDLIPTDWNRANDTRLIPVPRIIS